MWMRSLAALICIAPSCMYEEKGNIEMRRGVN